MDKRIRLKRETAEQLRPLIASIVASAVEETRGDVPGAISEFVGAMKFDQCVVPDSLLQGPLLDERLNDLLDMIYTDLTVQYHDAFSLEDMILTVRNLFESTIFSQVIETGDLSAKLRYYQTLDGQMGQYNHILYESFNQSVNYSQSLSPLQINADAGVMRLPAVEESHDGAAMNDVLLVPISNMVGIVYSSDPSSAYSTSPLDPFYTILSTNAFPENTDFLAYTFSNFEGALVDLTVRFPVLTYVSKITFSLFSNGNAKVAGVYYSRNADPSWGRGELTSIPVDEISYDNPGIDLSFERTALRELHVVLNIEEFTSERAATETTRYLTTDSYATFLAHLCRDIVPGGFIEQEDFAKQVAEIRDDMTSRLDHAVETIGTGLKFYVAGLYNLHVSDLIYSSYGEYESEPTAVHGNIIAVSAHMNGPFDIVSDGVLEGCSLLSSVTADTEVYVKQPNSSGEMNDACALAYRYIMENNVEIIDPDYPLVAETHFIPAEVSGELTGFRMYSWGEELPLPSSYILSRKPYATFVGLPSDYITAHNLYCGAVLTMTYPPAESDRYGRTYLPGESNLLESVGNPTLRNPSLEAYSLTIYVPFPLGGVDNFISYGPGEYSLVSANGVPRYYIGEGKGEDTTTLDDEEVIVSSLAAGAVPHLYVREKEVIGPFSDFYFGVLEEPLSPGTLTSIAGVSYYEFETAFAYAKGTLNLKLLDEPVYVFTEYSTDGTVPLGLDEKNKIYILPSSIPSYTPDTIVYASYVPIDHSASSAYVDTNIARHNMTETVQASAVREVKLRRYSYVDKTIMVSRQFDFCDGIFSLKQRYSVVYEPVVVYVNGVKARNLTEYRKRDEDAPKQNATIGTASYTVENGNRVVFDREVTGTVIVNYYAFTDSIRTKIRMYRSNARSTYLSPALHDYYVGLNARRW